MKLYSAVNKNEATKLTIKWTELKISYFDNLDSERQVLDAFSYEDPSFKVLNL